MTDLQLEQIPETDAAPSVPRNGKSTLDRIRSMYDSADEEKRLYLPIPQNALMGVCYRAIDPEDFDSTATKIVAAQLDVLIASCEMIVTRSGGPVSTDGKGWEPVLYDDGEPVQFDERFAELIGAPSHDQGGSARSTLLKAFSRAPSPKSAASVHFDRLTDWMAGEGPMDEEALLGES